MTINTHKYVYVVYNFVLYVYNIRKVTFLMKYVIYVLQAK